MPYGHLYNIFSFSVEDIIIIPIPIRCPFELFLGNFSVKVLKLARIIKSKEATGREKDKLALPVLRDSLATIEALEKNKKRNS